MYISGAVVAKYGDKSVYFDLEDICNTTGQWDLYGSDDPSPYNSLRASSLRHLQLYSLREVYIAQVDIGRWFHPCLLQYHCHRMKPWYKKEIQQQKIKGDNRDASEKSNRERKGHANLLRIVPILSMSPKRQRTLPDSFIDVIAAIKYGSDECDPFSPN
ncbi:hypothetical protein Q3G72_028528 [Acer saccharum]|nr:hypothetical protein Q3G72_028528 [Acer saccharum]